MLLFRMGPRFLFLRSEKIDEITKFLETNLNGEITDFQEGFEKTSEYSTLCFITDTGHEKTYIEDAKKIVLINARSSAILSSIINNNASNLINKVDMGPASMVMRVLDNEQALIDKLKEAFSAKEVDWIHGIGLGEEEDTLLAFTNKPLIGPVTDFLDSKLLIPQHSRFVEERLRLEGLHFITESLKDSQWYELRINIYDAKDKYQENHDRLIFVLSKLEIGMILGESWTKDYAIMLYSVFAYQVRLFTFITPIELKKILVALEYTTNGERMVDFDLYYKNKKIHWDDFEWTKGRLDKLERSKRYRQSLYEKLKPEDIKTLEDMEKAIMQKS